MTTISTTATGHRVADYRVIEAQLQASRANISQAGVVGRSDDGIHLVLTPAAAEVLAKILNSHDAHWVHTTDNEHPPVVHPIEDYDRDLWLHLSIDLLAARAMALSADALGQAVVYATRVRPDVSGYLEPRQRRGLKIVREGDQ